MNEEKLLRLREELEQAAALQFPDGIIVHGEGSMSARVMLIGEAPGEQETKLRRPFVGKAGKNLDAFLELAGIDRQELYVSNTVKLRPTKLSAAGNRVNRPPSKEELAFFTPYLLREIELLCPQVIVTLGNVPLKALAGAKASVGEMHGRWAQVGNSRLYPMYHPASLIYNRSLAPVYEADIRALGEELSKN